MLNEMTVVYRGLAGVVQWEDGSNEEDVMRETAALIRDFDRVIAAGFGAWLDKALGS